MRRILSQSRARGRAEQTAAHAFSTAQLTVLYIFYALK
jgi:hypothetical protein